MDDKSKVMEVESSVEGAVNQLAAITALGNKRAAGETGGGKRSKYARVTEYDLLPEDDQGELKWRGDPADTFSDWTIEVVSEGPVPSTAVVVAAPAPAPDTAMSDAADAPGGASAGPAGPKADAGAVIEIQTQTQTYHVHRYFLGFGTRRSEHFAKLFKEGRGGVSNVKKTKFELEPLAAKAFPDLLDFLYDPRSPLQIESETAVALHYLGIKLEMTHLQHYAKQFCVSDLSLQNLETYYQQAKMFDDAVVMDLIVQFIGKNVAEISASSNFVKHQTTADLWKKAMEHVSLPGNNFTTDLHLSKLVSEFGLANKDAMDATTFSELTEKIRKIDPEAALAICELDDEFQKKSASAAGADGEDVVSSIQQRCATALAGEWKDLDASDEFIVNRKSGFLVHLLGKCLQEAKNENEKLSGKTGGAGGRTSSRARGNARGADRVESAKTPSGRSRSSRGSH